MSGRKIVGSFETDVKTSFFATAQYVFQPVRGFVNTFKNEGEFGIFVNIVGSLEGAALLGQP